MVNFDGQHNPYQIPSNADVVGILSAEVDGEQFETKIYASVGRQTRLYWMVTLMNGKRVQVVQLNESNYRKTVNDPALKMLQGMPNYSATGCFAS